jgi:parallel beta-helix repeat protein
VALTHWLPYRLPNRHLGVIALAAMAAGCSAGEATAPSPSSSGSSGSSLAAVQIAPRRATIETKQVIRFYGTGFNAAGDTMATSIEWTATGGSISAEGVYSASTTGTFRVIGKAKGHYKSDTSTVVVVPPQPTLTSIVVSPDPATVVAGKAVSFSATGKLSDGSTTPIGVVWTATGGTIDAGGTYTAGRTPGTYHVIAGSTGGTVADTVPVTVTAAQLAQVVITPATDTLAAGATQQFTTYGRTSTGDSIPTGVSYTATGGTVSSSGLYTAGQTTGTFRVIVTSTSSNLADTSVVTIQSNLAQLILVPGLATVAAGGTVQFKVYGRTPGGDSVAAQASYTATGGTINSAGLYTAGASAGTFQVIAKQTNGTLADTAAVTINGPCTSTATMLCPGDNIQAKATAAGPGATLTLQPGVYRQQTVVALTNQKFVGQPGAIMSGAKLLTGWVQSGSVWYVTGQTQKFLDTAGPGICDASHPGCQYQEDVYRDDVLLTRVLSLSAVTTGTFYFDYTAQRIYVGDTPTGHKLEAAATEYAFEGSPQGAGTGVTIDGLVIEKYANPAATGAIGHTNVQAGWIIKNSEVRYNHGGAIRPGVIQVLNCHIHHNGQIGLTGGGSSATLIRDNEIDHNNTAGFAPAWEAGGIKFGGGTIIGVQVRHNHIHDNYGYGLWADGYNDRFVWDSNTVTNNTWEGITVEISYGGTITNNVITGNGHSNPNSAEGAGIEIVSSGGSGLTISGNTVSGNKHGIVLLETSRGSGPLGTLTTQNVSVHDNTVTLGSGEELGAGYRSGNSAFRSTVSFTHNTYNLQTADLAPFLWGTGANNQMLTDNQWKAVPNDATGTFNR